MATFDARNADEFFDMGRPETYAFKAMVSRIPYKWRSGDGDVFTAFGSGFTTKADGRGTAGTVTKLTVNFSNDSNVDVTVTGFSAESRPPLTRPDINETFWERMLRGDDRSSHR